MRNGKGTSSGPASGVYILPVTYSITRPVTGSDVTTGSDWHLLLAAARSGASGSRVVWRRCKSWIEPWSKVHSHLLVTACQRHPVIVYGTSLNLAAMSGKSLLLKVILLGDGGVGKSSLMNRYVANKFDSQAFHTIGVEFLNRDLEVDGRLVTLQIWDTAGQERFKSLRTPFYRGADCCLLTFSVDDRQSFDNLGNWRKEFIFYADVKQPNHFPFVVLGNKLDKNEREVSTAEAQAWCSENGGYPYLETSAKDDTNVDGAFEEAVRQVLAVEDQMEPLFGHTVDLYSSLSSRSSCC